MPINPRDIPDTGIVLDSQTGTVHFGNETGHGQRFHLIANTCMRIAVSTGTGPSDMASVLVQLAAYFIGSEYNNPATRELLTREMIRVLRVKAELSVEEVRITGFRLPPGRSQQRLDRPFEDTADTTSRDDDSTPYTGAHGERRFPESAPLSQVFSASGGFLRDLARKHGICPAELANDLIVTAGYYVGSTWDHDLGIRTNFLHDLEDAFEMKCSEAVALGKRDRENMIGIPPEFGWRGGEDIHENDPRRKHPKSGWLK